MHGQAASFPGRQCLRLYSPIEQCGLCQPSMIYSFLGATLKKVETGENNFINRFYLTQYIQNIISTCNQYKKR